MLVSIVFQGFLVLLLQQMMQIWTLVLLVSYNIWELLPFYIGLSFLFSFCVSLWAWFALLNLWAKKFQLSGWWGWLDWLSLGATLSSYQILSLVQSWWCKRVCAQGINSQCPGLEISVLGYGHEDFVRVSLTYLIMVSSAELPPLPLLERLAKELRRRLVIFSLFLSILQQHTCLCINRNIFITMSL